MKNEWRNGHESEIEADRAPGRAFGADRPAGRILVVDDDIQMRDVICRYLQRHRFDVAPAENGQKALDLFRRVSWDLVVTDLEMPVMGGLALLNRIRELDGRIPVVIITGQDRTRVERLAPAAMAGAVLYKPFDLAILVKTVRQLIAPHRRRTDSLRRASSDPTLP